MKYIGDGAFVPNIPARDLTDAEVIEYGKEALIATGLYVETSAPAKAKAPQPKETKEGDA